MVALSWPLAGAPGTQIDITVSTVQALANGPYTILSLIKPKATRGCTVAAKVSAAIQRELIIDSNTLYGAGDFVGYAAGMVPGDWHWIAQTKAAGNQPYISYRRDITAAGSVGTGTTGAGGLHNDVGSNITALNIGQGDNESRDDHMLHAIWLRQLSASEINSIFNFTSIKPVLALAPDALLVANVPAPAAVRDITGHGNNPSGVVNPSNILTAAELSGFDWATFFTDADMGSSETLDTATVAVEFTVPAGTAYRFRSYYPAVAGTTPLFRLYNAAGTLLASGSFDSNVGDTWNWFTPSAPIHLAAGTYRVAQYVSRYRFVSGFLASPVTRGGITANRGMFAGGADAVPNTASTVWFGMDMEFVADGGSDVFVTDPVAGGGSTGGQADGITIGTDSGGGSTAGTSDGVAQGTLPGGASSGGQPDGLLLGDLPGGASTGGTPDGIALGTLPGGASTGGQPDTLLAADVFIKDPVAGGASTGGTPDTVNSGTQVVHDQMVMPLAIQARSCLVTEVGKLANPPIKVQIRPGASFAALVDSTRDECCSGVAYVRTGNRVPVGGDGITPLTGWGGPSASRAQPPYYLVNLEFGIYRCLPTISNVPNTNDDFPTDAQWLQAAQDQADDGAALQRAVCCLQEIYGKDAVLAGATTPLENQANCSGIIVNVQVRAPACDCVD